jgi:hypothetical protein
MRFRESLEVLKLYKREEGGGSGGSTVSVMLRCQISDLTVTSRSGALGPLIL